MNIISIFYGKLKNQMKYVNEEKEIDFISIQDVVTKWAWSPSLFNSETVNGVIQKHRTNKNFAECFVYGMDFDGGVTLAETKEKLKSMNIKCVVGTTRNHQKIKSNGKGLPIPPCDRFRIIIFLSRAIKTKEDYKALFYKFKSIFPAMDDSCKDPARFYFPCTEIVYKNDGPEFDVGDLTTVKDPIAQIAKPNLEIPKVKGKLSNRCLNFVLNGAPDGSWHYERLHALFELKEQGYSKEEATLMLKKASMSCHGDIDDNDILQINDVYDNRDVKYPLRMSGNSSQVESEYSVKQNMAQVVCLKDAEARDVSYLWESYIPYRFVSLLTGDPGCGKSSICMHIAAQISKGGQFFDGKEVEPGNVLIFTVEDPVEEVLKPRLQKLGAIFDRIHALPISIELDAVGKETIVELVKKHNPKLVIIDPIVSYIGASVDTNKANQVRDKMNFLAEIAKEYNLAVLVVRHCSKNDGTGNIPLIYKGHGSIDFTASVRSEMMLLKDSENEDERIFGQIKSNLNKLGKTLVLNMTSDGPVLNRIEDKSLEQFVLSKSADNQPINSNASAIFDATEAIKEIVFVAPMLKKDFYQELQGAGFTKPTIQRTLKTMNGMQSFRISFNNNPRGVGIWLVGFKEHATILKGQKFEHLEQLQQFLSDFDDTAMNLTDPEINSTEAMGVE